MLVKYSKAIDQAERAKDNKEPIVRTHVRGEAERIDKELEAAIVSSNVLKTSA